MSTSSTQSQPTSRPPALWAEHIALLQARGIPADFAAAHGLMSVDLGMVKRSIEKYKFKSDWPHMPLYEGVTGILIPYPHTVDGKPRFRVRADQTEVTSPGFEGTHHGEKTTKIPRYLCQAGIPAVPYIITEVANVSGDTSQPLFIVEAPLKALSLTAHGFLAIGLGGVLAGANDKSVLDSLGEITLSKDLETIQWTGRVVYVVFDAGMANNPMVTLGAARLSLALLKAGADVRLVSLPFAHPSESDPENGVFLYKNDQGPDDYIARHGVEAFRALVDRAVPADLVTRFTQAVRSAERTTAIAHLLGELPVRALLHEGGTLLVDQVSAIGKAAGITKRAIQDAVKTFADAMQARVNKEAAEWTKGLRRSASGAPQGSIFNALLILRMDARLRGHLGFDELREEPVWTANPPWIAGGKTWVERPLTDDDAVHLVAWLDETFDMKLTVESAHRVLDAAAKEHSFHRVREYLTKVSHDGVERVAGRSGPGWLTTYLGVPDSPYARAVGRMTMIAAVARILKPGCKLDTMLVLEGEQGKNKSTSIVTLFGADYFSDQLSDITSKDASGDLRGKWVIEWSELDNLSRSESSSVKKYISRSVDDYRPAYGRRNVRVARQCVFIGTTNQPSYLKDETGNRRFWPVECKDNIDIGALSRDRDLLWAEAVVLFQAGEHWWLSAEDEKGLLALVSDEQEQRRVADPWEAPIQAALYPSAVHTFDANMNPIQVAPQVRSEVTTSYVLTDVLKIPVAQQNRSHEMKAAAILRGLGWQRRQRTEKGLREWVYIRPNQEPAPTGPITTCTTSTTYSVESHSTPDIFASPPLANSLDQGGAGGAGGDDKGNRLPSGITTSSELPVEGGAGGDPSGHATSAASTAKRVPTLDDI